MRSRRGGPPRERLRITWRLLEARAATERSRSYRKCLRRNSVYVLHGAYSDRPDSAHHSTKLGGTKLGGTKLGVHVVADARRRADPHMAHMAHTGGLSAECHTDLSRWGFVAALAFRHSHAHAHECNSSSPSPSEYNGQRACVPSRSMAGAYAVAYWMTGGSCRSRRTAWPLSGHSGMRGDSFTSTLRTAVATQSLSANVYTRSRFSRNSESHRPLQQRSSTAMPRQPGLWKQL